MGASSSRLATSPSTLRVCVVNSSMSTSPLWSVSISSKTFVTLLVSARAAFSLPPSPVSGSGSTSSSLAVIALMALRSSSSERRPSSLMSRALNCSSTAAFKAPLRSVSSRSARSAWPSKMSSSAVLLLVTVTGASRRFSAIVCRMDRMSSLNSDTSICLLMSKSAVSKMASKSAALSVERGRLYHHRRGAQPGRDFLEDAFQEGRELRGRHVARRVGVDGLERRVDNCVCLLLRPGGREAHLDAEAEDGRLDLCFAQRAIGVIVPLGEGVVAQLGARRLIRQQRLDGLSIQHYLFVGDHGGGRGRGRLR